MYDHWSADLASTADYYPGGMMMPGRNTEYSWSRMGNQGQIKDDEIYGKGNVYAFKYRMEDARINRFFSVDPLHSKYPHNSDYAFSENDLISSIELEGLEKYPVYDKRLQMKLSSMQRVTNAKTIEAELRGNFEAGKNYEVNRFKEAKRILPTLVNKANELRNQISKIENDLDEMGKNISDGANDGMVGKGAGWGDIGRDIVKNKEIAPIQEKLKSANIEVGRNRQIIEDYEKKHPDVVEKPKVEEVPVADFLKNSEKGNLMNQKLQVPANDNTSQ